MTCDDGATTLRKGAKAAPSASPGVAARTRWVVMTALVAMGLGHCGTLNGSDPLGQPGIDGGADAAPGDGVTNADAPPGTICEEEWKRITGPYSGEHEVDTFASVGCPTRPIGPECRVVCQLCRRGMLRFGRKHRWFVLGAHPNYLGQ